MIVILMTHWTMASTQTLAHTPSVSAGTREPYSHYCIHSWSLDSQADGNLNMQCRIYDSTRHIYTLVTLTARSRARWWSPWRGCTISTSIRILLTESSTSSYAFWSMPSGLGLSIARLLGRRYRSRVLCLHQHWDSCSCLVSGLCFCLNSDLGWQNWANTRA